MGGFWIGVGSFLLGLGRRLQGLRAILGLGGLIDAFQSCTDDSCMTVSFRQVMW